MLSRKVGALSLALALTQSLVAFANETPADKAALLTKVEITSPDGRNLICLGKDWEKVDLGIAMRVTQFKTRFEKAFYRLEKSGELSDCFAPSLLESDEEVDAMKRLLAHIDQVMGQNFAMLNLKQEPVPESTPAEKGGLLRDIDNPLLRAEVFIGGVEAAGMGVILLLPKTISQWDRDPLKWRNFKKAWTSPPVWDRDKWEVNYVGHPVTGSIYFNAIRSQGGSFLESFIFSTVQSVGWEYLVESWAEQPSIQDLLFTSTIGSLIGELEHQATLQMRKNGFNTTERVIVTIINPMYVVMNGYH